MRRNVYDSRKKAKCFRFKIRCTVDTKNGFCMGHVSLCSLVKKKTDDETVDFAFFFKQAEKFFTLKVFYSDTTLKLFALRTLFFVCFSEMV